MASRVKEDEKNERIIRGLLKVAENRRCINCNSLGPQYVCTNFSTFVCTTCSGIHREFTHRVKSVSMAKFTSQEVSALQEKGNKHTKELYFKEWDPQRHSAPDSSNVERLRDFIKHVYVDRRYSAEKNIDKPPRAMGGREDSWGGSISPLHEDTYERRYSERTSPGGKSVEKNYRYGYDERRSPGYEQESRQYKDSPIRPEIVNDWRREDRFGNGKKFEDRGMYDGDLKLESKSPERPKDLEISSSHVARPVREILRGTVVPRISEPPKANNGRVAGGPVNTQRTASSSSLGSISENSVEAKLEASGSLIDFDSNPEPPAATISKAQPTRTTQSTAQPTNSIDDNNWASFDFAPEANMSRSSNMNPLESALSQLSISASAPGNIIGMPGNASAPTTHLPGSTTVSPLSGNSTVAPLGYGPTFPVTAAAPVSSSSTVLPGGASAATHGLTSIFPLSGNSTVSVNGADQWPNMHHQHPSLFPETDSQSTARKYAPSVHGASGTQWNVSNAPNSHETLNFSAVQAPQYVSNPLRNVTSGVLPQASRVDVNLSERKELPQDVFTVNYPSISAPVLWWQSGPPQGMGYTVQYNTGVPMQSYPHVSKSANPFDLGDQPRPVQAPTLASMAPLQGAVPNRPPSRLMHTSSSPLPTWMPPQSVSYTSALPSPASTGIPGPYMGQQIHGHVPPPRHQSIGAFGGSGVGFGSFNPDQQLASRYAAAPDPSYSVGGNPFG